MPQNRPTNSAPSQPEDVENRLNALAERLAFAEHTLDNLGGVVTAVQAQLERLEREAKRIESLVERLSRMGLEEDLPHDKPPHY